MGEVIKNENVIPNGIPAFTNPKNIGIDEHEQNGVIAPKMEAPRCAKNGFVLLAQFFILSPGKYDLKTPITKIIVQSKRRSFMESYIKNSSTFPIFNLIPLYPSLSFLPLSSL